MMAEPAAALQAPLSSSMHTAAAGQALLPRPRPSSRLRATAAPRVRAAGARGGLLGMGRVADPCTGACCGGGPTGVCGVRGDAPGSPYERGLPSAGMLSVLTTQTVRLACTCQVRGLDARQG